MLTIASMVATPPTKPRKMARTNQKPRNFYTIHTHPNAAFTLKMTQESRTSIVGFKEWDDAIFIGKMLETYYISQGEWPDTKEPGSLILPNPKQIDVLSHIYVQEWDFDELKLTCTKNFLDLVSVDEIVKKNFGVQYTLGGRMYQFEADLGFYQMRLAELWDMNG